MESNNGSGGFDAAEYKRKLDDFTLPMLANETESIAAALRGHEKALDLTRAMLRLCVQSQGERMAQFGALTGRPAQVIPAARPPQARRPKESQNISEAILSIWDGHKENLDTDSIRELLPSVGYDSRAELKSMKSSINQAIAKLCAIGRVLRLTADGSEIDARDTKSRARLYRRADVDVAVPQPA